MDRDSGAPDHFVGPRGDIYTLVNKRNKTNIIKDDNADGNKEINRAIVSNSTKGTCDDTSNNIKYNGSNIYEIVEIPDFITPSSSSASLLPPRPPSSSKPHLSSSSSSPPHLSSSSSPPHPHLSSSSSPPKREMCSEEEAQLQDLLTDLLGMANDLCGSLKINEAALTNNSTNPLNVAKHIELNHIKAASSDSGFHQQFSHDDESHSSIHPPIIHHSSIHPPFLHHSSIHPSINIPPINDIYCELEMPNIQHHHQQQHKQQHHHQQQQQQSYDEVDTDQRLDKKEMNVREDQSSAQVIDDTISSEIENSKPLKENHYAILERDVISDNNNNNIASPNNMKYKSNFVGQHFANPDLSEDGVVRSEVINIGPGENGSHDNDSDNNYDHFDRYHNHHLHDLHHHNHHLQQHHIQDYDYNNYNNYNNYNDPYDVTAPLNLHLDENTCSNCGMFFEDHNGHMCRARDDGEGVDDDFLSLPIDERSDSINSLISTPYANTPFGCSSSSSSSRNGRMEYKRNKGRKRIKEMEVVTLEPIGIGVQLLERYNYNPIDNPLQLNLSDNDMFDTATPYYPNNHPPIHLPIQPRIHPHIHLPIQPPTHPLDQPYNHPSDNPYNTSTAKRHAPLAKSISSGYHGDRATLPDSQWEEGFYYSPQPQRNHSEAITQRQCREEVSCQQQYMQDNGYQNHSSNNSLQNRFRQNSSNNNNNNNSKLPARLRPKFNNANNKILVGGYHGDVNNNNNNSNYSINDAHPQHKHSSTQGLSIHPSSPHHPHHHHDHRDHHQNFNSFRPLNSSTHPPLTSSHSLQIHNGLEPGFEPATSSMPRSMKLITAKYHQISEPQLFRSVAIDSNMNPLEVVTTPCFVTDQSKRWYHPVMSREQAIKLLLNKQPGSFIIRNSNSFEGAYGLVMKVDKLPQQVTSASPCEYVRHFLIETTTAGVRIRGSPIEPTFGSLSTLVYQHMLTPLSLPCLLILNRCDDDFHNAMEDDRVDGISQIIEETFYYVNSECTEGLTGQVAMSKVINKTFNNVCLTQFMVTKVKLRLDVEGLTLTDLERKLFFRKKYAWDCISYSGVDNSPKVYFARNEDQSKVFLGRLFCIVARNNALAKENVCHILASLRTQDHSFINVVEAINDRIPSFPR